MRVLLRKRGQYKTTAALWESVETGYHLVVKGEFIRKKLIKEAKTKGLPTPNILTFKELLKHDYAGTSIKGVIIDDADLFLKELINLPISLITLTEEEED